MDGQAIISKHFTQKRHEGLLFFRDHPNETGRDVLTGSVLGTLQGFGLIQAHPHTSHSDNLLDTAFTLTEKGEAVCKSWSEHHVEPEF